MPTRKKIENHEIPTRKYVGPTMAQWHYTHETHDGTKPTEFSIQDCF